MKLEEIANPYTLSIFCDAAIRVERFANYKYNGCCGVVATTRLLPTKLDHTLDTSYRVIADTTNNNAEIQAVRDAVSMAITYKDKYSVINIFSDSQVSILGIRDRIMNWRLSDSKLYGVGKTPISSQDTFIEILLMMIENNLHVQFFHQQGHVDVTNHQSLRDASHVFMASNGIREKIDLNLIRYISYYNNLVDSMAGMELKRHREFTVPVLNFFPNKYPELIKEYRSIKQ